MAPTVAQLRLALEKGRLKIDRIIELPERVRTLEMRADAIEAMIAAFDQLQPIVAEEMYQIQRFDHALLGSLKMVHEASDLREFAGRVGSYLFPYVAAAQPIDDERLRLLERTVGQIDQLVRLLPYGAIGHEGDRFAPSVADIRELYVGNGLQLIRTLIAEGR